jgi:hypothetical protein
LDYPAGIFPVSQVLEKEDSTRGPSLGDEDAWNWKQCMHTREVANELGEIHGEKGYAHAPVSLQIVGGRWDDENVVEAMARIEKAMGRS